MSLNPPNGGLRTIKHNAISPSKVSVSIPAGDELTVSDEVADQLLAAAGEFQEVTEAPKAAPAKATAKKSAAKK